LYSSAGNEQNSHFTTVIYLRHSNTLQKSAASALIAVNNVSVEAALESIQQQKKRLAAIQEDDSRKPPPSSSPSDNVAQARTQRRKSPEKSTTPAAVPSSSAGSTTSQQRTTADAPPYDLSMRISPIQLPGFKTPVSFDVTDLPPPPAADYHLMQRMSNTIIKHPQPVHLGTSGKVMSQRQIDDRDGH